MAKTAKQKTLDAVATMAADIKVLQDHGADCGCWECARANDTIGKADPEIIKTVTQFMEK
jgi:hypothetical protein